MKNWKQIAAWKNASMQPSLGIKRYPATTRHATTTMTWLVLTSLLILCCYCLRQSILWPRAWQQRNVNDLDYQYLDVMGATLGVQFGWWRSEPDTKFGWWRSEPDTTAQPLHHRVHHRLCRVHHHHQLWREGCRVHHHHHQLCRVHHRRCRRLLHAQIQWCQLGSKIGECSVPDALKWDADFQKKLLSEQSTEGSREKWWRQGVEKEDKRGQEKKSRSSRANIEKWLQWKTQKNSSVALSEIFHTQQSYKNAALKAAVSTVMESYGYVTQPSNNCTLMCFSHNLLHHKINDNLEAICKTNPSHCHQRDLFAAVFPVK